MLGRFFKSYSSSQSEKRLTINFRFSSAVCRARLRFLKCFIFEDFIIKIRCEIVWQSYAVALQSKMTGKSWGRDQSSFLWCTTAMAHVPNTEEKTWSGPNQHCHIHDFCVISARCTAPPLCLMLGTAPPGLVTCSTLGLLLSRSISVKSLSFSQTKMFA